MDELDVNGWDLRKALRLFARSNPAFVEWIQSPIVYAARGGLAERARALLPQVYSCTRDTYHYRSMARNNYRGYLRTDPVRLKQYFYVLRPLLAVRWLERHGTAAPIEFQRLLSMVDDPALLADIHALLALKSETNELGEGPAIPRINAWIEAELARLEALHPPPHHPEPIGPQLDTLFRELLEQAWA